MTPGPFARRRQAIKDEKDLGTELWRRSYDRFSRSLDRYWQIVDESAGTVPQDEMNGLINAGNVLADLLPRVRALCSEAHRQYPDHGLQVPAGAAEVHRILSRAANDLATTAQAAAFHRLGQGSLDSVGRRAEKVITAVDEAEAAATWR